MTEYKKGYKCFISYSGVDQKIKDVIQGYCDKLVEEYKKDGVEFSTWSMDRDGVGEWAKVFPKELEKSDGVIMILSHRTPETTYVDEEAEILRERVEKGKADPLPFIVSPGFPEKIATRIKTFFQIKVEGFDGTVESIGTQYYEKLMNMLRAAINARVNGTPLLYMKIHLKLQWIQLEQMRGLLEEKSILLKLMIFLMRVLSLFTFLELEV